MNKGTNRGSAAGFRLAVCFVFMLIALSRPVRADYAELSRKSIHLTAGHFYALELLGEPDGEVEWSTSNKSLVSVKRMTETKVRLRALRKGTAVITAKAGDETYSCEVTVKKAPYLSKTNITMRVGEKVPIRLVYGGSKAHWYTSNGAKATLYAVITKNNRITAWKTGRVKIGCRYKGKAYYCVVRIRAAKKEKGEETPAAAEYGEIAPPQPYTRPAEPDVTKAQKAAAWCENIALDNRHGYDNGMENRWGKVQYLGRSDYSCSSMIIQAYEEVGVPVKTAGSTVTSDMRDIFLANGFEDVTKKIDILTGKGLKRGDVLIIPGVHTEIYLGNGMLCGARGNAGSGLPDNGYAGDQTNGEIAISEYFGKVNGIKWVYVLRYPDES